MDDGTSLDDTLPAHFDVVYLPGYENEKRLRFRFSDVGKTVFLTREEAEAALEKMKRGNE